MAAPLGFQQITRVPSLGFIDSLLVVVIIESRINEKVIAHPYCTIYRGIINNFYSAGIGSINWRTL
jgi:hypothetical protein